MRGSGTTKLVFAFTVPSGLKDDDGIELYSGRPLRLNGSTITAVSDGLAAVWNLAAEKNGTSAARSTHSGDVLSGGICDRTLPVRYAIVAAVASNDSNVSNCSQVTESALGGGDRDAHCRRPDLDRGRRLRGLSGITTLTLDGSGIATLPAGLFDGLGSLLSICIVNVGLTHLPKDYFRGSRRAHPSQRLDGNRLAAGGLPDGIFEPLTELNTIRPRRQPGLRQLPAHGGRRAGRDALGRPDRHLGRAGDRRRALGVQRDLFVGPDRRRRYVREHGDAVGGRCREAGLHCAGAGVDNRGQAEAYWS